MTLQLLANVYGLFKAHLSKLVGLADVIKLDLVALHVVVALAAYNGMHSAGSILEGDLDGRALSGLVLDAS